MAISKVGYESESEYEYSVVHAAALRAIRAWGEVLCLHEASGEDSSPGLAKALDRADACSRLARAEALSAIRAAQVRKAQVRKAEVRKAAHTDFVASTPATGRRMIEP